MIDPIDNPRVPASPKSRGCGFYVLIWIWVIAASVLLAMCQYSQVDPHKCAVYGTECP